MQTSVEGLAKAIADCDALPLVCIGSGGSLTAAHFAALLHEHYTGRVAKALTPLEVVSASQNFRNVAALILSAGGRNPDALGVLKHIAEAEPIYLTTVCSRKKSPLAQLAGNYRYTSLIEFDVPSGKDGFLATNSLLAFLVLLSRAYTTAFSLRPRLPNTLEQLAHPQFIDTEFYANLYQQCLPLWGKETLIVLYGPTARTTAIDLESKFTEAALGTTQLADYRNFAHGRHHWLAKHGATTGVIALVTSDDRGVAEKTLRHLPTDVPIVRLESGHRGEAATIATFVSALHLVKFAGEARGIDPGRPGVPAFGRKIYHMRIYGSSASANSLSATEIAAIERKTGENCELLQIKGELEFWREAYRNFVDKLHETEFQAVVFDYDGTLCDGRERYTGLSAEISLQLARLLKEGVRLGIATGRGKSVREALRDKLPRNFWSSVFIGYYNGADIGRLDSDERPDGKDSLCDMLVPVGEALQANPVIVRLCSRTHRRKQITVEPHVSTHGTMIFNAVQQIVYKLGLPGVITLRSSHSIDILAPGASKRALVEFIQQQAGKRNALSILCIGDRGQFPGNDFSLLQEPYSLTVDESSNDPQTCWNLAPRGYRGTQAAEYYSQSLILSRGRARIWLS